MRSISASPPPARAAARRSAGRQSSSLGSSARRAWTRRSISVICSRATVSIVLSDRSARSGSRSAEQTRGTGLDEDHVDRVAGGVVKVARDPGALPGGDSRRSRSGLALGALGTLLERGNALAPQLAALPPPSTRVSSRPRTEPPRRPRPGRGHSRSRSRRRPRDTRRPRERWPGARGHAAPGRASERVEADQWAQCDVDRIAQRSHRGVRGDEDDEHGDDRGFASPAGGRRRRAPGGDRARRARARSAPPPRSRRSPCAPRRAGTRRARAPRRWRGPCARPVVRSQLRASPSALATAVAISRLQTVRQAPREIGNPTAG